MDIDTVIYVFGSDMAKEKFVPLILLISSILNMVFQCLFCYNQGGKLKFDNEVKK